MRCAVILTGLVALAACAGTQADWERFDGQPLASTPSVAQQAQVDFATCRAMALNAANGVPMLAPTPQVTVTNNVTVPVYVGPGPAVAPPAPSSYQPPAVGDLGIGDAGAALGASIRRHRTQDATMSACMAQRGYRPTN